MTPAEFQPVPGMSDLAPPEIHLWQQLEASGREILERYGFEEVRTPLLEPAWVFERSLGDTSEVVQKEMYRFEDRGGRQLALRPEGTAGLMRYLAGCGPEAESARLYYLGPMFRCERPQAGRRRQFHQLGAELMGPAEPMADAECVALQYHILSEWGLSRAEIRINTRGSPDDQRAVAGALRDRLVPSRDELCEDCRRRIELNVWRILDCKREGCRAIVSGLPPLAELMGEESRRYFQEVLRLLSMLGIPVRVEPRLVRGLDYYLHTVWEVVHPALGAQDAVAGGGRYRIKVGRRVLEGVGFAVGLERAVTALSAEGGARARFSAKPVLWVVSQGDRAREENLVVAMTLRRRGWRCEMDLRGRSVKAQMRAAHKAGAAFVIIRGEREMERGTFLLKDMAEGRQEELSMAELLERLGRWHRA